MRWREILFWGLGLLFLVVIVGRFGEIENLASIIGRGRWQWILAAVGLQAVYYTLYIVHYRASYWSVESSVGWRQLAAILFAGTFINLTAPSGGTAGAALMVDDFRRRGEATVRAAAGTMIAGLVDYLAIAILAGISSWQLYVRGQMSAIIIIGLGIVSAIIMGMTAVLFLGIWSRGLLRWSLNLGLKLVNRGWKILKSRQWREPEWAGQKTEEFSQMGFFLVRHPERIIITLIIALISYLVNVASVWALFAAFGQGVDLVILITGFAMGMLFWAAAVTPQGVGTSEGAMILTYSGLGVPATIATMVTLGFRGMTLWIPAGIGFFCLKKLRLFAS